MTFGEAVFSRRRELGLTQKELAYALNVSNSCIAKIESGRTKPSSKTAKNIARILRMDEVPDDPFLTGDKGADLAMLEKRVNNAIFELERVLDIIHSMKGV